MNIIKIQPTKDTPAILFDPYKGIFRMAGRSLPENSLKFWIPVLSEIEKGVRTKHLDIRIKMEYYNTSSSKCIFDLFRAFKSLQQKGTKIAIRWYYDEYDEDILEAGEDYQSLLDLPVKFVKQPDGLRNSA